MHGSCHFVDSVVGHGHYEGAQCGAEDAHSLIGSAVVFVAWPLERIRAIVARECSRQANQHLSQRRMDIEEERAVDVPTAHLAKVCLVPAARNLR